MFNLGYKEVVLNSMGDATITTSLIDIPGYGKFKDVQVISSSWLEIPSSPAVGEISTWATVVPANLVVGDAVEVTIDLRSSRQVGDLARDFITHGEKLVFQSAPVATADTVGIEAAVTLGWQRFVDMHPVAEQYVFVDSITGSIQVEVLAGYEHVMVKAVKLKRAASCTGADNCFVNLEKTVATEGDVGTGLGKFIEESRRMGTPENVMPYNVQHGGNSQGIDVRGTYKSYIFDFQGEDSSGWQSHEYVDHSYVQASMASKPVHYVIYVNDQATDLITALDAFVAAG